MTSANPQRRPLLPIFFLASLFLLLPGAGGLRAEEQEAHAGILKDWDMYGSVRLEGAYWSRNKWYRQLSPTEAGNLNFDSLKTEGFIGERGGKDSVLLDTLPITHLRMGLQNNSYFGVRGRGEKFGFAFEMGLGSFLQDIGLGGTDQNQTSELYLDYSRRQSTMLRKIYGDWYVTENLTLRVGQDWNIANFFISDQVFNSDAGLGYSGILYTGRRPQIKLMGTGKRGGFGWKAEAAAIKQDLYQVGNFVLNAYVGKPEEKLPKFEFGGEVSQKFSDLVSARAKVVGGFTQYDLVIYKEFNSSLDKDLRATVKSNLIGGMAVLDVWKASARVTYARGQNLATYGVWMGNPDASLADNSMVMFMPSYAETDDTTGLGSGTRAKKIHNAETQQGAMVLNVRALPWLAVEGGAGMVLADHELAQIITNARTEVNGLKRWAGYANLQFTTAGGHLLIVPEFTYNDLGGFAKGKSDEGGGLWYSYGLKLELDI